MEIVYKDITEQEAATLWNKGINIDTASEFVKKQHMETLERERQDRLLSLREVIARQEKESSVNEDIPLNTKQMWDGNEWVPLCLSKAHRMIKNDKDFVLRVRMYSQCVNQPEFGETIKGWRTIDSEYLADGLARLSDLKSVSCSCCAPQYTSREVLEGDIKEQEQEDPWFRQKQIRRA